MYMHAIHTSYVMPNYLPAITVNMIVRENFGFYIVDYGLHVYEACGTLNVVVGQNFGLECFLRNLCKSHMPWSHSGEIQWSLNKTIRIECPLLWKTYSPLSRSDEDFRS